MKKINLSQEVFDLYDQYAHNKIERREFVERISMYAVGGLSVGAILEYLLPNYEERQQVKSDDPRLNSEYITYDSSKGGGIIKALLARPVAQKEKLAGIIVVHENRGLNPHIEDVARRAAIEGFIAIAPDALSPLGGYPGNDDDGRAMQKQRDKNEILEDFVAAFNYLKSHPECNGNIGVVGFCFGGWISNMMAVRVPDLLAAVPFYGKQVDAAKVPQIQAPLLLHFAAFDPRVNEGWPAYAKALQDNNKEYSAHLYPDVNHGFHNDTTPRYNDEAATLAWDRTIEFFNKKLKK